jgi:hypothetical protein
MLQLVALNGGITVKAFHGSLRYFTFVAFYCTQSATDIRNSSNFIPTSTEGPGYVARANLMSPVGRVQAISAGWTGGPLRT